VLVNVTDTGGGHVAGVLPSRRDVVRARRVQPSRACCTGCVARDKGSLTCPVAAAWCNVQPAAASCTMCCGRLVQCAAAAALRRLASTMAQGRRRRPAWGGQAGVKRWPALSCILCRRFDEAYSFEVSVKSTTRGTPSLFISSSLFITLPLFTSLSLYRSLPPLLNCS
jgi:hypothetical protein